MWARWSIFVRTRIAQCEASLKRILRSVFFSIWKIGFNSPAFFPFFVARNPTAALSSGIQNWTPELLAEAHSLGLATFVNVLGAEDTPENLRRALDLRFDYIQTDHQIQLQEMIRNKIR
jgi:hypothetical protein